MKRRTFLTLSALAPLPLTACFRSEQILLQGQTMGTTYSVKYAPTPAVSAKVLQAEIDAVLVGINQTMSTYDSQSELSRINQIQHSDWINVSSELYRVLDAAQRISALSQGTFDITVGPLVNLWGFGPDVQAEALPASTELAVQHARVGYQQVQFDSSRTAIRKQQPQVYLDLSGIAKGLGVDKVAALLDGHNIHDYLVEIGGEMRSRGQNQDRQAWRIAVEEPTATARRVHKIIPLSGQSIATSGSYRNFFEHDGQRYSHMIDPRTAWPIRDELALVSVISDQAMQADALSTALMIAGPEQGPALAEQHQLAALFINVEGDEYISTAFRPYLA